jgi:hypothetical protein
MDLAIPHGKAEEATPYASFKKRGFQPKNKAVFPPLDQKF